MGDFSENTERFTGFSALYDRHRSRPPPDLAGILMRVLGADRAGLVVDAAWLSANLSHPDLVVLQVGRAEAPEGPFIPGAVPINLNDLAVTSNEEGETRIALDLPADLTPVRSAFEVAGVSDDSASCREPLERTSSDRETGRARAGTAKTARYRGDIAVHVG